MEPYPYSDVSVEPDLQAIQSSIGASAMVNTTHEGCIWYQDSVLLKVFMSDTLIAGDITILDGIVSSYQD